MRIIAVLLLAGCAAAQPPFTLDRVLSAAFPSELTASPTGGKFAWVENARGVRNIWVAEAPRYQARQITDYTQDDGYELSGLVWTPDGEAIAYARLDGTNRAGEYPNPALNPKGTEQDVWLVSLAGGAQRKIGEGDSPAVAPRGARMAWIHKGQLWLAPADGSAPGAALKTRGECADPVWSPDGARIAFESDRGDHGFIGVYDVESATLRYLDPSTDRDIQPAWSPDGRSVAFIRIPSSGVRFPREARRAGEPWSIRVAAAETGEGREIFRGRQGTGSVFREVTAVGQILWAGSRLVFPWEADGWTHLYSIPAAGGDPLLLTPGAFEVDEVALAPDGREVFFNSNQGDIDRRHLWKVAASGGTPEPVTQGDGIEWAPAPAADGALAFLRSDAEHPAHAAIRLGGEVQDLHPESIPADFPLDRMVTPQQVIFSSADGLAIHGQLFLPPNRKPGSRAPAVVFFHGGSQRQMLLGWHYMYYYANAYAMNQYLANSGFVVLSVNYRSGIGYGLDFREALRYGPSGASEYNDVQGAGVYLRTRSDVDPDHIGAWGGSYGGYLTAMALARASDLFRAGVDLHGVHDWAAELGIPVTAPDYQLAFESSPMAFLTTWRSPVLLIQGDDDRNVHFNQTVRLADALRRQHVEVEELVFPDEVHDFLLWRTWLAAYQAGAGFLERKLK
ncbi:MAG: prolyl oligopeptidase family serine peptidase [Bryobacteraceae bacterium]|jgi:dipeptidyl aminopeptidase/acylaminoacyl peptidase